MLELVDLTGQRAVLILRRTAALVLLECVERIEARLVEIELALHAVDLGGDRRAPGGRRFRELRLQSLDASAESGGGALELLQSIRDIGEVFGDRVVSRGCRRTRSRSGRGILAGLRDECRLRARVLERQPQNFSGGLTVVGEKKRLVGIAHELRFDAEMPVPIDYVAQIGDDGARIGTVRSRRRFSSGRT